MTLVELMVTMVIASIVAASTFMFFAGQQRVYETQTKMLNVQQNAWAAMEVLTRFVRAEGSGMFGCVRPVGGFVASPPLNRSNPDPEDSDDPPVAVNPIINNLSRAPNAGLRANAGGLLQRIPPLWIVNQVTADPSTAGIVPQTDVITVAFGNRSSGTTFDSALATAVTTTANPIVTWATQGPMFQAGEFIVLVGEPAMGGARLDIGCTLFQVTSVTNDTLNHSNDPDATCIPGQACTGSRWNPNGIVASMIPAPGYGVPSGGPPPTVNPNTGIRNFGELWWVQFAIRNPDPTNPLSIPVLTMQRLDGSQPTTPQVLAEGIEDLQVAFACDLNADGVLTEGPSTADEWTLNVPGDPVPLTNAAKCNQPTAVRLTLVARSLTEDNGINANLALNGPLSTEDHVSTCCATSNRSCCDQFRRRVMTTTVYPRNN
jgi:type II secretory pathway pseudopilin PulG